MAVKFASHGYDLIINGRRRDRLENLQQELCNHYNTAVLPLCFDIQNRKEVTETINGLSDQWKQVSILINNAGLAAGRDYFEEASLDDWDTMIDTNVKGL